MSEMRDMLRHYFNIGTPEAPKWVLLGDGITSLTEEFNPESETKQYINEMLAKLDESDEIFLKQLSVIIRKHLDRKHLGEKRGR